MDELTNKGAKLVVRSNLPAAPLANVESDRAVRLSVQNKLERDINPRGSVECLLIEEVARRTTDLRRLDLAIDAIEDQASGAAADIFGLDREGGCQAIVTASSQMDGISRRSVAASSALLRALRELREISILRQSIGDSIWDRDPRFRNEADCCAYLLRRFLNREVGCHSCPQGHGGSFIAARQCYQCARCHRQTSIRHATVMERSHIELGRWFDAIRVVLLRPSVSVGALQDHLGIRRVATVRGMRAKIRNAVAADDASQRLAGLDEVYLG